uniref:Uncharacterized protein n=1 Tax=Tanacetum cinerariifolium TaxID=118510 RepID=A0A699J7I1_TANCI|nr:hypothetical protein [Tanacetum cinerariifolium]
MQWTLPGVEISDADDVRKDERWRSFDLTILGSCLAVEVFWLCDLDINAVEFDAILVLDHADLFCYNQTIKETLTSRVYGYLVFVYLKKQKGLAFRYCRHQDTSGLISKEILTFRDYDSGVKSRFAEYGSYHKQLEGSADVCCY